jgi:hypothetical protein
MRSTRARCYDRRCSRRVVAARERVNSRQAVDARACCARGANLMKNSGRRAFRNGCSRAICRSARSVARRANADRLYVVTTTEIVITADQHAGIA